jgi:hypothetical protein
MKDKAFLKIITIIYCRHPSAAVSAAFCAIFSGVK